MYPPKRTSQILHWHWEGLAGPAQDSEENLHYVRKFGMCYWSLITQHIGISEPSLLYLQVAQFHLHQHLTKSSPLYFPLKGSDLMLVLEISAMLSHHFKDAAADEQLLLLCYSKQLYV